MINYRVSFPLSQPYIIRITISSIFNENKEIWELPKWRPGRYALQSYYRNISSLHCTLDDGEEIEVEKVDMQKWELHGEKGRAYTIEYTYYAKDMDAGGAYVDEEMIMLNGIHCFLHQVDGEEEACKVDLELPSGFRLSKNWKRSQEGSYFFDSFHELVDSPFIAGKNLTSHSFMVEGLSISFWMLGIGNIDLRQLERDITKFTLTQFNIFGSFPIEEFHYLFVFLPYPFFHGVEHQHCTVITLGPGNELKMPAKYSALLELSSHEFFHVWNVKAIRPSDFLPYRYNQAVFSEIHYVTEGVTTYYGDLSLWKSHIWDIKDWVGSINKELKRHYLMPGKDRISLEEASVNSWVNGYHNEGIPGRKISFYVKGYLVAMLLDVMIMEATNYAYSMDILMRLMYREFGSSNKGYTAKDYKRIAEELSGRDLTQFFSLYIEGTEDLRTGLEYLADQMGLMLTEQHLISHALGWYGLRTDKEKGAKIINIWPNSPAEEAGLYPEDEIIAVNGQKVQGDLDTWLSFYQQVEEIQLSLFRMNRLQTLKLKKRPHPFLSIPQLKIDATPSKSQLEHRLAWQNVSSFRDYLYSFPLHVNSSGQ